MGLGLIVGVAALGVISARSVVERRQQIGVLRAIGFRRAHGAGDVPARVVVRRADRDRGRHRARRSCSRNIISDPRGSRAGRTSTMVVPWAEPGRHLPGGLRGRALATLAPARRAARIRPAEALRYQ